MNYSEEQVVEFDAALCAKLESAVDHYSHLGRSCLYAHFSTAGQQHIPFSPSVPLKVYGSILIILVGGRLSLQINSESYVAEGPTAVSIHNGATVYVSDIDHEEHFDCYMLFFAPSFLQEINISFSAISSEAVLGQGGPLMPLQEREVPQVLRYLSLIHNVMSDTYNELLNRHIISSLSSAFFYQMVLLLYKRVELHGNDSVGPRRINYVHDFLRLVHVYYVRERSVSFYASKLFISPKYLSLLVKEATGRSAARWIDHFVIMEAKNLLRYSGKNVQQVAYALNFSNQSSFGKYFKHLTGMSPTDYQKSLTTVPGKENFL